MLLLEGDQRRQLLQDENLFLEHAYWAYPQSLESHAILIWWTETSDVFISWKRIFKPLTVAEQTLAEQSVLLNKQGIAINYGMAAFDVRRRQKERDTGLSGRYISCHYLPGLALGLSYVTESVAAPVLFLEAMWKLLMSVTCIASSWDGREPVGKQSSSETAVMRGERQRKRKKGEGRRKKKKRQLNWGFVDDFTILLPEALSLQLRGRYVLGKIIMCQEHSNPKSSSVSLFL